LVVTTHAVKPEKCGQPGRVCDFIMQNIFGCASVQSWKVGRV